MGLTFWSDRLFEIGEMTDGLYHCALPLTDIENLSSTTIRTAFSGIDKMYGGGDGPEDVLLGNYLIFHDFKEPDSNEKRIEDVTKSWMLVTKTTKNITSILKLPPTHFVSNICHQHQGCQKCSEKFI